MAIINSLDLYPKPGTYRKMKPHVKQAYRQGQGNLRRDRYKQRVVVSEFCCLGVLCDIGECKAWETCYDRYSYYGFTATLPPEVENLSELTDKSARQALMAMNDNGVSFNGIAWWIEKVL